MPQPNDADSLLNTIVRWAEQQPDIAALIMTGSRARPGNSADALSDYDLEIFTDDPVTYTESDAWMREIADVWTYLPTERRNLVVARLVVFAGGGKADFSICPTSELAGMAESQQLDDICGRGYRVLLDRDGLAAQLPAPSHNAPRASLPSEAEFRAVVDEFWFEASHIPKYLQRGELWVVKHRDWTMKQMLLQIIEWHAAAGDSSADIWHIGTKMRGWAAPGVWDRLHETFAQFEAEDSRSALHATTALFRDLATETATRLGYRYPQEVDDAISGYISAFDKPA